MSFSTNSRIVLRASECLFSCCPERGPECSAQVSSTLKRQIRQNCNGKFSCKIAIPPAFCTDSLTLVDYMEISYSCYRGRYCHLHVGVIMVSAGIDTIREKSNVINVINPSITEGTLPSVTIH